MISRATPEFSACFARLPDSVQVRARGAYALWSANPRHPSLQFKPVRAAGEDVWPVRIGIHWRALAVREGDVMIWFWIGSHADYDRLISWAAARPRGSRQTDRQSVPMTVSR